MKVTKDRKDKLTCFISQFSDVSAWVWNLVCVRRMLENKHALLEEDVNRRAESDTAMRGRAFMVSPPGAGASTMGGSASKTDYQLHDKTNGVNNTMVNKQVEESKDSMSWLDYVMLSLFKSSPHFLVVNISITYEPYRVAVFASAQTLRCCQGNHVFVCGKTTCCELMVFIPLTSDHGISRIMPFEVPTLS